MPTFYGAIDLSTNELRNAVVQNLPTPPTGIKGRLYMDTAANILYWYNGTQWIAAQGAATNPATTVTTEAVGDAPVVGASTNYAREDHKHGREGFGGAVGALVFGLAASTGSAATVPHSDHHHGTPVHDAAAHSGIPISALAAATSFVLMGGNYISNLADPLNPQDGATKAYVDNAINGLAWKDLAAAATTANIVLSGAQTIDGIAVSNGSRVLVKNQTLPAENGLFRANTGAWTRTTDADSNADIEGMAVYIEGGTVNGDTSWVLTTAAPITVGTTGLTYVQFAGPGAVTAGAGMTQAGSTLNVIAGDTSLTVAADDVRVNTAVIATVASVATKAGKYAGALVGTASPEVVTHNLNTRDVQVTVLNGASPYTAVEVDWDATSVNTVTIRFNPNLGAGYRVVVVG